MRTKIFAMIAAAAFALGIAGCKKDESTPPEVKSRFTVTQDTVNGFKVNIHNDSENATTFEWNFGDGSTAGNQSDTAFSYTYASAGTYTITLTVSNGTTTVTSTKQIVVSGMTFKQFLAGTDAAGKIWHLEFNSLINMFNPSDLSQWWYGWNSLPTVDQRNTVRHHEYIFKPNGSFEFKTNGFTIRPGLAAYFGDAPTTAGWPDSVSWTSGSGIDCSTWGNNANLSFAIGTASYYPACTKGKILINGLGGHIGPMDAGTTTVSLGPVTQSFYEVYSYTDGGSAPDTLVLFTPWGGNENGVGSTRPGLGYMTLVSYKSADQIPADEVEVIVNKPLQANDISDDFDTPPVNITWVQDNGPALFDDNFDNPYPSGIDVSAKVAKYVRGTNDWANLQFELPFRMDLSTRNVFKMKVYIDPAAAVKTVSVKLQDTKMGANAWQTQTEVKQQNLTAGQWIELTFDFSSVSTNTNYDKVVVQFGDEGANKGDGTFYFDDFMLQ